MILIVCFNFLDRPGLKGILEIQRLNQALLRALRLELGKTHKVFLKGDVTVLDILLSKTSTLRELSSLHMEALGRFRRSAPHLDFPALHKELFSVDMWWWWWIRVEFKQTEDRQLIQHPHAPVPSLLSDRHRQTHPNYKHNYEVLQ